jgi:hypothetical protein
MGTGTGYAAITSGRVLNAKHATASRVSTQSSRQVWDRVARAASSSSTPRPKPPDVFPPLPPPVLPAPGPAPVLAFYQGQRKTPWTSSSSSGVRVPPLVPTSSITSSSDSKGRRSGPSVVSDMPRQAPPPELSNILFPELPVSKTAKVKPPVKGNASFRNIVGDTTPLKPAWAASNALAGDGGQRGVASENGRDPEDKTAETGKSKKAKGKQKQMLFTLGTYPV